MVIPGSIIAKYYYKCGNEQLMFSSYHILLLYNEDFIMWQV